MSDAFRGIAYQYIEWAAVWHPRRDIGPISVPKDAVQVGESIADAIAERAVDLYGEVIAEWDGFAIGRADSLYEYKLKPRISKWEIDT